jgi:hypothetical protein
MKNVSDYISRNQRKIDEFIDYVYSFYNVVDGIYPIKGCTKHKINLSTQHYLGQCSEDGDLQTGIPSWGDGDSLDRERVRDIMFELFPKIKFA